MVRSPAAYWVPDPTKNFRDMIDEVYGVTKADGRVWDCMVCYVHKLNPHVISIDAPLGPMVLKLIDIHGLSHKDLVCERPDDVVNELKKKFHGREIIEQSIKEGLPSAPEDIEIYRMLLGYVAEHSTEISQTTTAAGGLFATGEMVSKELAEELTRYSVINEAKIWYQDMPTDMGRLNVEGYAIKGRIMKRLGSLERFAFVGSGQKKRLKGDFHTGIVPSDNLRAFLDRLSVIRNFYKSGSAILAVIDIINICANIKAAAVEDRRKAFYQETGGLVASAVIGYIGNKLVVAVWRRSPVGGVATLGLALFSGYHAINQAKEGAGVIFDMHKDILDIKQVDYLIQHCR